MTNPLLPSLFREGSGVGARPSPRLASESAELAEARTHPRPLPQAGKGAEVAREFEALFIAQLLKATRAAHLADDPLAPDDSAFRDAQDRELARSLAAAAPLGVAKLLTR